eukprot:scaffold53457_cov76-Cyclotella_meneghiniana.AAC.9
MPHMFLPNTTKRRFALNVEHPRIDQWREDANVFRHHVFWAKANAWTYLIGGVAFIIGSIFFLPAYEEQYKAGCIIFLVASIAYMIVAIHDLRSLHRHNGKPVDYAAAINYIAGSLLFMIGSALFLPAVGMAIPGGWCFIIGSMNFVAGAVLNGLQIFDAPTRIDSQYMLITAMSYIIGSVFFLIPSIPYIRDYANSVAEEAVYKFCAGLYIVGSCFFTIGGIVNFRRYRKIEPRHQETADSTSPLLDDEVVADT